MNTVYPDYYPQFKCIASRCRHNCCIGWEIDIDPTAAARYAAMEGEMGRRLKESIDPSGDAPHFILGAGERCPFLNENNLCDLIIHGGEDMLCQICTDHPRFRNELMGRTELGIGLCCEAAAELILGCTRPVRLITVGEGTEESDEYTAALTQLRDRLITAAQDRSRPFWQRLDTVAALCGLQPIEPTAGQLYDLYQPLERMDEEWTRRLEQLQRHGDGADMAAFWRHMSAREHEPEQLLVYFLYRHVAGAYDDGAVAARAALGILSVQLICRMAALQLQTQGSFTTGDMLQLARLYSQEVEYSAENTDALLYALDG